MLHIPTLKQFKQKLFQKSDLNITERERKLPIMFVLPRLHPTPSCLLAIGSIKVFDVTLLQSQKERGL